MRTDAIEELFNGRKVALEHFRHVRHYIEGLGGVKTSVTKTQVSFGVDRKFAWVWLPQMWIKKQPEDSIVVTFALDRRGSKESIYK